MGEISIIDVFRIKIIEGDYCKYIPALNYKEAKEITKTLIKDYLKPNMSLKSVVHKDLAGDFNVRTSETYTVREYVFSHCSWDLDNCSGISTTIEPLTIDFNKIVKAGGYYEEM